MGSPLPDRRRDPRRRAAIDIALALADLDAGWGDYERALEHLEAADELSGGALGERVRRRRDGWRAAGTQPAGAGAPSR